MPDGTDVFETFMDGKFVEAVVQAYAQIMGEPFFYLIIFSLAIFLVYLKSQDLAVTGIVGLMIASITLPLVPPEIHFFIIGTLALSIVGIFYRVFK